MKLQAVTLVALLAAGCKANNDSIRLQNKSFATECQFNEEGRRCKWDDTGLDLDSDKIELTVEAGGPSIICHRNQQTSKPGTFVGRCNGAAQSANFVERRDKNGNQHVYGSIVVGEEICHMSKKKVSCESASNFPEEEDAGVPLPEDGERNLAVVGKKLRGTALDLGLERRLYNDLGDNLDIMVVWTKEAECRQSGFGKDCILDEDTELEMRGIVDLAVSETNTAFTDSGIETQLRLVHAYRDDTYTEPISTQNRYKNIISHLQSKTDGHLDSVHMERARYGADFVAMIVGKHDDRRKCARNESINNLTPAFENCSLRRFHWFMWYRVFGPQHICEQDVQRYEIFMCDRKLL